MIMIEGLFFSIACGCPSLNGFPQSEMQKMGCTSLKCSPHTPRGVEALSEQPTLGFQPPTKVHDDVPAVEWGLLFLVKINEKEVTEFL